MIPPNLTPFRTLAGVPVHWGRWGRTGTRYLQQEFLADLELCLEDLWQSWLGPPAAILSGGAYVPGRDPKTDRHGNATAFDLSGFRLPYGEEWRPHRQWTREPRVTLAIEAVLRKYIPQVLGPWYNKAHQDHWHVDDRQVAEGFQLGSRSDVAFVQACLKHFWGHDLALDGSFGPKTRDFMVLALISLGEPQVPTSVAVWRSFLQAVKLWGFGKVEAPDG